MISIFTRTLWKKWGGGGITKIPSTNDNLGSGSFCEKSIYRTSIEVERFFLNTFSRHYSETNGFYDPIMVRRIFENSSTKLNVGIYKKMDMFLFYQLWLDKYKSNLIFSNILDIVKENIQESAIERGLELYIPSEYSAEINKWMEFYNKHRGNCLKEERLPFICTMDVEGFAPQDLRSVHTAYDNYVERLLYGNGTVEKVSTLKDVSFTFFVEIFSDIYRNENEWAALLKLCSDNGNEAGMHCHGFSLGKNILDKLGIDFWGHATKEGFGKIIQFGINRYRDALGHIPYSYRSGSFEVLEGHFDVLKKHGIKIDSSLYHQSNNNFYLLGQEIKNGYENINGIMELPITTYYNVSRKAVHRFDLNTTSFSNKLELIVRSILNNAEYLMMICHSWSFCRYDLYKDISKKYHTDFSQNVWDEFMYMLDFVNRTESCEFVTCQSLGEKLNQKKNLVDIVGSDVMRPVYGLPPEYGHMRDIDLEQFVDLTRGIIENDGKSGYTLNKMESNKIVLSLNTTEVPLQNDRVCYSINIPCVCGRKYKLGFILTNAYYKKCYEGRNRIRYYVLIDNQLKYYDFVTNPIFDEAICVVMGEKNDNINLKVVIECLENEMPWGWGRASKVEFKYLYLEEVADNVDYIGNRFILIDNNYKFVKSQTSNIDINFNVTGMEIIYNKIANENNYIQFFDNKFSTGPSLKYQKMCEIPDSSPVFAIVNFKIKGSQEKQQMSLYYMSYEGYEGERVGSVSRKCVITNKEKYISLKFDIVPKSKVFKLAIKLGDDVNTNVIEFSELEIIFYGNVSA